MATATESLLPSRPGKEGRGLAAIIAVVVFLSAAWFTPQAQWNDQIVSRLGLTLSIVERGELSIDRFADRTIDKAESAGRFYSDKVPGHSLLAVPAVAIAHAAFRAGGLPTEGTDATAFGRYNAIATLFTNGLLAALGAAMLFLAALRLGASREAAAFGTVAVALGSPLLGWSTAFFAHSVTASLLIITFATVVATSIGDNRLLAGRPLWGGLLVGLLCGITLTVDLTAAPATVLLALYALAAASARPGQLHRLVAGLALGGAAGLAPLPIYNSLAFGSPLTLGYSGVVGFVGMKQGLFGIGWPDPDVLYEVLLGEFRGLLPLTPVLALAPIGVVAMALRQRTRAAALVVVLATATYLWINAGYVYWDGGNSTGPRHLVPMLPFLGLALCFAWPRHWALQLAVLAMLAGSLALSSIIAAIDMFAPVAIRFPMREVIMPRLSGWPLQQVIVILTAWALVGLAVFWPRGSATRS